MTSTSMRKTAASSEMPDNSSRTQWTKTYCEECDWVLKEYATAAEYLWLCMKHPRMDGHGFVSKTIRDGNLPPYLRCKDVNGGYCYLFKPKATTQTNLPLKEDQNGN